MRKEKPKEPKKKVAKKVKEGAQSIKKRPGFQRNQVETRS
jgi:hypothetical protein